VKDKVLGNVDFPGKDQGVQTVQDKIDSIEGKQQIHKLITDTNNLIAQLKQGIELKIQGDRIHCNTALFSYHFDVSKPGSINNGSNLAMQGNFVGALAVDGVSFDPGTLLENDFIRQTTVSFHLFDVFQFTDVKQYFEKTKLIYTGNQALRFSSIRTSDSRIPAASSDTRATSKSTSPPWCPPTISKRSRTPMSG
jgi:hypothetical protein